MKRPNKPQRHQWFDRWAVARGQRLQALAYEVRAALDAHERETVARQRRRKESVRANRDTAVEIIVANLAHAVLMPPETGRLAVLTGNNGKRIPRYTSPATGKVLRDLLNTMDAIGLTDTKLPQGPGEASSVAPSDDFCRRVRQAGIELSDFGRHEREEVIVLSRKTAYKGLPGPKEILDYVETAKTTAMREEVRSFNAFMESASITFEDDGGEPVDIHKRTFRRHFVQLDTGDLFDHGGRLYGGFWQNLKRERRPFVRIEGEQVALLDFSSMFTRLAYARMGLTPPAGDLYAIPGLEAHRPAVKVLVNALLFDGHHRTTWPKDAEEEMPIGWDVPGMKKAILRHHPHLRRMFGRRIGHNLMHTESEVMVETLKELQSRRIVALGLHDGLLIPASRADEARDVMEAVALDTTSAHLPVVLKAA